jgi:DNA-binding SARP family transcriptional activator
VRLLADRILERRSLTASVEHLSLKLDSFLAPTGGREASGQTEPRPLAVYCLGPFRLELNGQTVQLGRAGKARALFQYLVSHRARPVAREAIMDALWPDSELAPASATLKVVVHRLRSALGGAVDGLAVETADEGYRLDAPDLWVDVEEFDALYALGRRQESLGQGLAAASYARAAELYHGDFFEETSEDWVVLRRERLKDRYLHAVAWLSDAAYAHGDYESCIERCQQILPHDPCREQAYRYLMLCYAHLGQRGRVRRWYDVCVQTLRDGLDVEPEARTRALYRDVMAGQVTTREPNQRLTTR